MRLTILGATGSIGRSTLDVVARHPGRFQLHALTAHRDADGLLALCRQHRPRYAVLADPAQVAGLERGVREAGLDTEVLAGDQALVEVAKDAAADTVVAAIVGAAGLLPSLAAVEAGKRVLLANKEALVCAGAVFMAAVTPAQACAHPNWSMGRKISVDSATMMNKGLEVIEACWLFDLPPEQVDVVVHPQSVIHSLVDYADGSMLAQLGNPDMRTPIAHALAWPERIASGVAPLDLVRTGQLNFQAPDVERFPCLALAYRALRAGGNASAVLNAANEVAVEAFLSGHIGFMMIAELVERALDAVAPASVTTLEAVLDADAQGRAAARRALEALA